VGGVRGVADGGLDFPPSVAVQLGEVATLRPEDIGELADVELAPRPVSCPLSTPAEVGEVPHGFPASIAAPAAGEGLLWLSDTRSSTAPGAPRHSRAGLDAPPAAGKSGA